jgi:hypothetical protein
MPAAQASHAWEKNVAYGLLFSAFDISDADEAEFNDWYDHDHIPEREAMPGFLNARRWLGAEDPKLALATYDLQSLEALTSPDYLAIANENMSARSRRIIASCRRLARYEGEQVIPGEEKSPDSAGGLLLLAMNIAADREAAYGDWFRSEWMPTTSSVPGLLSARRFRARSGSPEFAETYHFATPDGPASPAWQAAVGQARTQEMHKSATVVVMEHAWRRYAG